MRPSIYIPAVLQKFQGFFVKDLKEWRQEGRLEVHLEQEGCVVRNCHKCGSALGSYHDSYKIKAKHLKMMDWQVEVVFFREKRFCFECKKVRSQSIEWLCPNQPHVTLDLAWWLNRLTEVTTVLAVSRLESLDKMSCYRVDKFILRRLLQGYKIPKVTQISVDEVYARSKKQMKDGETRDDLFLTVIVDMRTRKVIWVSQSRRKEALDDFFQLIGKDACQEIKVVACDQHRGYSSSVEEHCPSATIVWDRFHLVQQFNEALNQDRRDELENIDPEGKMEDLMNNKYKYIFCTKADHRSKSDRRHIESVMSINKKMYQIEIMKEHFHKVFDCVTQEEAKEMINEIWCWSIEARAHNIKKWIESIFEAEYFWNYFKYKVTTGLSEGINRVIKGLKWQAYGYKDMAYFALKILQKCGYLNSEFHQKDLSLILSSHKK